MLTDPGKLPEVPDGALMNEDAAKFYVVEVLPRDENLTARANAAKQWCQTRK